MRGSRSVGAGRAAAFVEDFADHAERDLAARAAAGAFVAAAGADEALPGFGIRLLVHL